MITPLGTKNNYLILPLAIGKYINMIYPDLNDLWKREKRMKVYISSPARDQLWDRCWTIWASISYELFDPLSHGLIFHELSYQSRAVGSLDLVGLTRWLACFHGLHSRSCPAENVRHSTSLDETSPRLVNEESPPGMKKKRTSSPAREAEQRSSYENQNQKAIPTLRESDKLISLY